MIPWKLNPLVINGESMKSRAFRKTVIVYTDCCGFGNVFGGSQDIPIADDGLMYT